MFVDKIKQIVSPPNTPVIYCNPAENNKKIGITLPKDYYDLINIYGAGNFGNFINLLVPYIDDYEFGLFSFLSEDRECYLDNQDFVNAFPPDENDPILLKGWKIGEPFDYYPEDGGLIPWGKYPCGNEYTFYWKTVGDDWTIVVFDDLFGYIEYNMSMTEYLYNLFTGKIVLDEVLDINNIKFIPFADLQINNL